MKTNNVVYCGNVDNKLVGKEVVIKGWIKKNRKLGSLIFIDIYDITGIVQVVVEEENKFFNNCLQTPKESVVEVIGIVRKRSNVNKELKTGEFEIDLKEFKLYSKAETPPFLIQDDTDGLEDLRLKYRYLDLRRPVMQNNIINRGKIINLFRSFLVKNNFNEIETPYLSKQTPEGARDYLVPTRSKKFFALPQSPQIYKQLLMVSGMDRYFQIARCFRDEDLRADRQPEFTQIDIETSFLSDLEIQSIVQEMFIYVFKEFFNIKLKTPFTRMSYSDAIEYYGSDKPDIRFENKIMNLTNYFKDTNFKIFKSIYESKNRISAVFVEDNIVKQDIKKLEKLAQDNKAKGLAYLYIENGKMSSGSIANVIESEIIEKICKDNKLSNGTLFFVADKYEITQQALGAIRKEFVNISKKIKMNEEFAFLWVVDWPLFEYSEEEKRYVSAHHPFTMPTAETLDTFDKDPANAKAIAYDLVLNGFEIGGGSLRIYNSELQTRMFKFLGLNDSQVKEKFGFIINAFKYGVPPHGGIAFGIERILMIMLNTNSIRDVIAFPKNSSGVDLLFETPSDVSNESLKELGIKLEK
ncbi:aspartate--tRNA ligase [Malacoplasma penetrans]|uniref:Aspartate--tRNA ligase n=1 Tax=Malacoplasma penetrans (strain HF-2) TaxID=272633 RepID=SYD_MALP2|nr:aspartate--tRNA ligase [Malacoplasma penetrans]Q8EWB7.1 RecName: Full=Aspartate--tRNA ligase; AltName: Full=Aspartyl-tRNA synthetase; Short=AspRS [Malacoplasma penetrans HF-2]RXY96772.1 aspartate--tRNA ligase [Malacoplasma penetrans]BAC44079.1 aspartyl-tRNA synthetase [Malacoplasma penetrans HF-2]